MPASSKLLLAPSERVSGVNESCANSSLTRRLYCRIKAEKPGVGSASEIILAQAPRLHTAISMTERAGLEQITCCCGCGAGHTASTSINLARTKYWWPLFKVGTYRLTLVAAQQDAKLQPSLLGQRAAFAAFTGAGLLDLTAAVQVAATITAGSPIPVLASKILSFIPLNSTKRR